MAVSKWMKRRIERSRARCDRAENKQHNGEVNPKNRASVGVNDSTISQMSRVVVEGSRR